MSFHLDLNLDPDTVVSSLATFVNILLYLSGITIIFTICKRRSTKGFFILPFASCLVCCLLWIKYGLLTKDDNIIFVNLLGAVIEGIYTAIFYMYSTNKAEDGRKIFLLFLFLFSALAYTKYVTGEGMIAVDHHGIICSLYNIFNYAAPLGAISHVIQTKTTGNLSYILTFLYFLCALFWYMYGVLHDDFFIKLPNFLGIIFGAIQMSLFLIYPRSKSSLASSQHTSSAKV